MNKTIKKLKKRNQLTMNTVEKYACACTCWCVFPWTKNENSIDTYNGAR